MDKTRTINKKWLANELDLHFLTLKEYTKDQSNLSILSKVIILTDYTYTAIYLQTDRQTYSRKSVYRFQMVSKRGNLKKTWWKRGGGSDFTQI